jgi:hypothetical protein
MKSVVSEKTFASLLQLQEERQARARDILTGSSRNVGNGKLFNIGIGSSCKAFDFLSWRGPKRPLYRVASFELNLN